jgi:hypothetical protein
MKKIVAALVIAPLALVGLYWLLMIPQLRTYQLRSEVTPMMRAAEACRDRVAEYYTRHGRMPPTEKDVECAATHEHVMPPQVASGVITISANGALRQKLIDRESATQLRYVPVCQGGPCAGAPIASWDCRSSPMERDYRPGFCR